MPKLILEKKTEIVTHYLNTSNASKNKQYFNISK